MKKDEKDDVVFTSIFTYFFFIFFFVLCCFFPVPGWNIFYGITLPMTSSYIWLPLASGLIAALTTFLPCVYLKQGDWWMKSSEWVHDATDAINKLLMLLLLVMLVVFVCLSPNTLSLAVWSWLSSLALSVKITAILSFSFALPAIPMLVLPCIAMFIEWIKGCDPKDSNQIRNHNHDTPDAFTHAKEAHDLTTKQPMSQSAQDGSTNKTLEEPEDFNPTPT